MTKHQISVALSNPSYNYAQSARGWIPWAPGLLSRWPRALVYVPVLLLAAALGMAGASAQTNVLVNGGDNVGTITLDATGMTNDWSFSATAGNSIVLRLGITNFDGGLNLYGPDGTLLGTGAGEDVTIAATATNSGVFTVRVSSYFPGGAGDYILHLARIPESFITPAGHAGGPLTNGGDNAGTLAMAGLDRWTLTAQAGDNVVLRLGTTNFVGLLNVYGPDGTHLTTGGGSDVPDSFTATNGGVFTALVSSFSPGGIGAYKLRLAQFGEMFGVPAVTLINGGDNNGTLKLAGLDRWSFAANSGDNVILRLGTTNFVASLNVYGPDGTLLTTGGGSDISSSLTATNSGVFTALVSCFGNNGTGAYALRLAQFGVPFAVPGTNLTNGVVNEGTLGLAGLDRWNFTAKAGDNVVLRLGTTNFISLFNVYGPDGTLLSNGGGTDISSSFTATNTGVFTALVTCFGNNGTGAYGLRLAQFGLPFAAPGAGLNNGGDNAATLVLAGLDRWNFTAAIGDNVVLRLGTTNFTGELSLYGPDGTLLSTGGGTDIPISFTATNSGTFTALVNGLGNNGTGAYVLRLADFGQPFVVPAVPLVNGGRNQGTLALAGLDRWMFTAGAGDNVVLRLGANNFVGSLNVYGPDGARLLSNGGTDVPGSFTATNSGNFTALVTSLGNNGVGGYVLRLAHVPGVFVLPPGEQGGGFTGGTGYTGAIHLAGLEIWTFAACQGEPINLTLSPTNFLGEFALYGPDGACLASNAGTNLTTIDVTATNCGTFTVIVSSFGSGGAGIYSLTANGLSEGIKICPPAVTSSSLTLSGTAGPFNAGAPFVLYTATNLKTPATLWTPIYTSQFDRTGVFNFTNDFSPNVAQQYFRFNLQY